MNEHIGFFSICSSQAINLDSQNITSKPKDALSNGTEMFNKILQHI
jgi:hypothetical protein